MPFHNRTDQDIVDALVSLALSCAEEALAERGPEWRDPSESLDGLDDLPGICTPNQPRGS